MKRDDQFNTAARSFFTAMKMSGRSTTEHITSK